LESLERNARAEAQLVDDMLDVSRIISGKLAIKSEPVDVTAVVAGAVETVKPAADAKRVALHVALEPDAEVLVTGDSDRLRQVVWNLLSNAIKFTGRVALNTRGCTAAVRSVAVAAEHPMRARWSASAGHRGFPE
jgi:signal transduction histidine kinase